MSISSSALEATRLQDIAEEYKQRGYTVTVSPGANALPRFLSKFRPDLLAESPDESVIIEIKSANKIRGSDYWKQLSSVLQRHPGWRLELVLRNMSSRRPTADIGPAEIQKLLAEGEQLSDRGMLVGALLVTWSAAEAAMRAATKKFEVEIPDVRPGTVIGKLYSDGFLDREQYEFLINCMQIRNAVAHGFHESQLKTGLLRRLRKIVCDVLNESQEP